MITSPRRALLVLATLCTLLSLVFAAPASASRVPPAGQIATTSALPGSLTPLLRSARRLRPMTAQQQLTVTITLRVGDEPALAGYLAALDDPASPTYHHFLTPRQFGERFAPDSTARSQLAGWLQSRGLRVSAVSANQLQVTARGTIAAIQNAFGSPLYTFRHGARTFYSNTRSLELPAAVAPEVLAISGLTDAGQQQTVGPAATVRTGRLQPRLSPRGFSPANVAAAYDLGPLLNRGIDGTGQTVGIVSFADYTSADIAAFDQQYGLSAKISRVSLSDGRRTGAQLGSRNGQDEAEGDIEVLQGSAPRASIVVYEAPNNDQGALAIYNRIVSDDKASVITTSWGDVESNFPPDDLAAIDQVLQEGAAQGQAFFAASGDNAAFDAAPYGSPTELAVDFPAADPWVTGVGGTTLTTSGSQYASESVWSDNSDPKNPTGSGGGLSSIYSRPSYQNGPGVANSYSNGMRQIPDVAANADPQTGYAVYTVDPNDRAGWGIIGGTSMAAPLWAGFAALVNQATGRRIGFLNPLLYLFGQDSATLPRLPFHDVTQGDNLHYPATAGWDFATGWGSFDADAFVADLSSVTLPTPVPIPTRTSTPIPTATPVPTARPALTISISQILLLHKVNGTLKKTGTLKVGEKGTIVILYQSAHAGSLLPGGKVLIRQNGKPVQTITLKRTTYQGKPALTATVTVTNKKWVGSLLAHVTATLGSVSAILDHPFKLTSAR